MPHPGAQFPIPPLQWPHVGQQWPPYNLESDQAEGLMAWWPTLASSRASTLRDLSGHGHTGTLQNLASWPNPYMFHPDLGWMINYPGGANDWYVAGPSNVLDSNVYSIAAWFITDVVNAHQCMFSIYTSNGDAAEIFVDDTDNRLFGGNYNNRAFTATSSISAGVLYHILLTSNGTNTNFYLNGLPSGSSGLSVFSTFSAVTQIGARSGAYEFDGRIGGVRAYNRAFTDSQAAELTHPDTKWELHQIPRHLWRLGVVAPPPAAAALPIFPPPDAVHSLVFGGVTVR